MFLYKPKQHEGIGTGIFLINQGIGATKFMFIEMCAILFTKHMGQLNLFGNEDVYVADEE